MFYQQLYTLFRRCGCCLCLLLPLYTAAQNKILEIHHINIENGDATMIVVHDTASNTFPVKILIDGGNSGTDRFLQNYFTSYFGAANMPVTFKYLILTHFHKDHYAGFNKLGNGTIFRADTVIDPGGYTLGATYGPVNPPQATPNRGAKASSDASIYKKALRDAFNNNYLQSRSLLVTSFPRDIGQVLKIDTLNGVPATLKCLVSSGYTYGAGGAAVNDGIAGRNNANNFSLGFILEYGQFRYFTAGDMGGYKNGGCSAYIDQEVTVDGGFDTLFNTKSYRFDKKARNVAAIGHVCAFKTSHHGSDCSSSHDLMKFTACAMFLSAGNMSKWGLPEPTFQKRIDTLFDPLSEWSSAQRPLSVNNRGIYITNLYNFPSGTKKFCRSSAINLFANKDSTNFSYGNDYNPQGVHGNNQYQSKQVNCKDSYVLKVEPNNITTQSQFYVFRVNYYKNINQPLSTFKCHRNTPP
ncbi:hypothetical protein CLV51_106102 [Chitinophaga niastensis]|uniref:Beta-lactamase superfamily II metal-dependent hydrolase n=1 Tax=Chitinophaga niastensis TaxID=536980 RepID=A0A2P8HDC4_CHINA|nr:hypothetical protein [Chitinophaga niastensis]PSL44236.1 hypothetical protein CLV51_106102 [Chitinophaga niastensis]